MLLTDSVHDFLLGEGSLTALLVDTSVSMLVWKKLHNFQVRFKWKNHFFLNRVYSLSWVFAQNFLFWVVASFYTFLGGQKLLEVSQYLLRGAELQRTSEKPSKDGEKSIKEGEVSKASGGANYNDRGLQGL